MPKQKTNNRRTRKTIRVFPQFPSLDILRVGAALLVMTGHVRALFFEDYSSVVRPTWFVKGFYFLTALGHQSVMIFFVLSGLLVGTKVVIQIQNDTWSWSKYIIDRGSRLCIVLWPALILTFAWDYMGNQLFGFAHNSTEWHLSGGIIPKDLSSIFSLQTYIANTFFLQGAFAPSAGSNGALWSLSNEFWYYIAFPTLLIGLSPNFSLRSRIKHSLVFLLACIVMVSGSMIEGFLIWLIGVFCGMNHDRRSFPFTSHLAWISAGGLLFGTLIASRFQFFFFSDIVLGLATGILCLGIIQTRIPLSNSVSKLARFFSSFSYTLYLTHLPFVFFIRAWFGAMPRFQPDILHIIVGVGICLSSIAWAYLVYRYTEYYTPNLRDFLLQRLETVKTPPKKAEQNSKAA